MALVVSDPSAVCAGALTTNRVQAAPVLLSRVRLNGHAAHAVLLNSGCANCLTGPQGFQDAVALSRVVARELGVPERQILVASTGVIGRRLPVSKMARVVPFLVRRANRTAHRRAALAILTTDTRVKETALEARMGGRVYRLGGMAKGAGMIAPAMATMLCVLTTDVAIEQALLDELLQESVAASFNRISVDGDMSTNDTVFILANGRSGVRIRRRTSLADRFAQMLSRVTQRLARLIVQDGEGATRVATIDVEGAETEAGALACARAVAISSLVRTMLTGGDPNVGRIAAAVGASGVRFRPDRLEIRINGHPVVVRGCAVRVGKVVARQLAVSREVVIGVDLRAGRAHAAMLTCDLSEAYVRLNARYPT
jgi:glutamate N-acetyltransferase/amino-acid N-acetyltransferase